MDLINERFNKELFWQIEGRLPKGHIYKLGMPSEALLASGVPNLSIELLANMLRIKSKEEYVSSHPFNLNEVKNLPIAIAEPLAIFDSKTRIDSKVILTMLESKGVNFVVAMQMNAHPKGYRRNIEINDIRSIYPKDNVKDIINWINREDLLKYVDKNKILNWITQQQSNSAEVAIPNKDFNNATKVIQNFENPKYTPQKELKKKSLIEAINYKNKKNVT